MGSQLAVLLAPLCCSPRLRLRLLLRLWLRRLRHQGWRRPPGALGPGSTPLLSSLLVGGAREDCPEPGTILTDRLLVRELREPGPK